MSVISKHDVSTAEKRLSFYSSVQPDVVSLAMLASPARRVEAGLLRILRLKLAHHFTTASRPHVGTEAGLWFSSLVESRGLDSLTLLPDVLHLLRSRLCERAELLEEVRVIISESHLGIPPIISWEEDITYYGMSPALDRTRRYELLQQAALSARKALGNRGGRGLEKRIDDISRRIPKGVAQHPDFRQLITLSQQQVTTSKSFSLGAALDDVERAESVAGLPTKEVRIKKEDGELLVGELNGPTDFRINVPNVTPLMIQASEMPGETDAVSYLVPEGGAVNIPVPRGRIYLYTLDGSWYEISLPARPSIPSDSFLYDVFLAHSSKDKAIVRELAERLKSGGVYVWFDEWQLTAADNIYAGIEKGLEQSRTLLLCMSANAFGDDWPMLEAQTMLFREPGSPRRFVPVRLDDHELPLSMQIFLYVDWREQSDAEYVKLLTAIRDSKQPRQTSATDLSLKGHTGPVLSLLVADNQETILSGSWDKTIRLWSLSSGVLQHTIAAHDDYVTSMDVHEDLLVSGSWDGTVKVWNWPRLICVSTLKEHAGHVLSVAISPSAGKIVSASEDETIKVWDVNSGSLLQTLRGHDGSVFSVAFTPDSREIVSGGADGSIKVWDSETGQLISSTPEDSGMVLSVACTSDARAVVFGLTDGTVKILSLRTSKIVSTFEGHVDAVMSVAITPDSRHALSGSADGTIRVWEVETGRCVRVLDDHTNSVLTVAVSSDGRHIVSGDSDNIVRIVEFPSPSDERTVENAVYASANVLFVGDSGVGKTALAQRLSEARFKPTKSTEGYKVWKLLGAASNLTGGIEREIWLWDYGGQEDFSLFHQRDLDVAIVVLVFDPQTEDPFKRLAFWDDLLKGAWRKPLQKFLVGGRVDIGRLILSREHLEKFMRERSFTKYFEVSAFMGTGCEDLQQAIADGIPWDDIPRVHTTSVFRRLREAVFELAQEDVVLLRMSELKQQLDLRLPRESFSLNEVQAIIGVMANQRLVYPLGFDDLVLLQPGLLSVYGSAIIRTVRRDPDGLGAISEETAWTNLGSVPHLAESGRRAITLAVFQLLIGSGLCFTDPGLNGTRFVFPAYVMRERPESDSHPPPIITYHFKGAVTETYASLVTRLRSMPDFRRVSLWRDAADFDTREGYRAGIKLNQRLEGEGDIRIFFGEEVADEVRVVYLRYIHDHLSEKATDIKRIRHYTCSNCGKPVFDDDLVQKRLKQGKNNIICMFCGNTIRLADAFEELSGSENILSRVHELEEMARIHIDEESLVQIIMGSVFSVVAEAGQIFRPFQTTDGGIDGEIEFRNDHGEASGRRVYLILRSSDSMLLRRGEDDSEVLTVREPRHLEYWRNQTSTVMLVLRTSDGHIRWMNMTDYLKRREQSSHQIIFAGEPLTALNVAKMRNRMLGRIKETEADTYEHLPLDNQAKEALLIGRVYSIVGEAGQIFRSKSTSFGGIGGEIEFRDDKGNSSGRRVYLNLKSGGSHLRTRKRDGVEIFRINNIRHIDYWLSLDSPVMLIILTSDGAIRWMNLTAYIKRENYTSGKFSRQIVFDGEPFTTSSISQMRDEILGLHSGVA